jgi:outer membrane immunogenic protein
MKKFLFATVTFASLIGTPALAADMALKAPPPPAPAPPTWTSCYIGLNLGGDVARSNFSWSGISEGGTAFAAGAATVIPEAANATLRSSGVIGGGQVGCNYQTGVFVVGLEGDFDGTGLRNSRSAVSLGNTNGGPPTIVPGIINESFRSNWLSTVRGRVGIANGPWLFYGTGGLAIANVSFSDQLCFPTAGTPICNAASSNNTRTGWAAGGGIEWMFTAHWSAKVEYIHADLGTTTYTSLGMTAGGAVPFPGTTINHSHSFTEDIGRAGVNWHF